MLQKESNVCKGKYEHAKIKRLGTDEDCWEVVLSRVIEKAFLW